MSYSDFHRSGQPVSATERSASQRILATVDKQFLSSRNNHTLQVLHERKKEHDNVCQERWVSESLYLDETDVYFFYFTQIMT